MKRRALVTLSIGNNYFRLGLGLMISSYRFLKNEIEYVIFYANADPSLFNVPHWITLIEINLAYPIENAWSGMRYKAIPLIHKECLNCDVLFLDADTLVYENRLSDVFDIIRQKSVLVYGKFAGPHDIWLTDEKSDIRLNLKSAAALIGYDVDNLFLNSGIIGRANDSIGHEFAEMLAILLDKMPLQPWLKQSPRIACSDEPYVSIAYQLSTINTDKGQNMISHDIYQTTVGAYLSYDSNERPTIHKPHLELETKNCAIVHFVAHSQNPNYMARISELVPFRDQL